MSLIMKQIKLEHPELFALEFGKIAETDFVYTLASTNINHAISTKLGENVCDYKVLDEFNYGSIGPELSELSALELENFPYLTLFTLASANIDQSVPNLATICLPIRSRMSLIIKQLKPEHSEVFAFEFGKIAETDFVYTLASTNINQSAPNLVKMYVTIRSWMSSIMDLIGAELSELFALEFA